MALFHLRGALRRWHVDARGPGHASYLKMPLLPGPHEHLDEVFPSALLPQCSSTCLQHGGRGPCLSVGGIQAPCLILEYPPPLPGLASETEDKQSGCRKVGMIDSSLTNLSGVFYSEHSACRCREDEMSKAWFFLIRSSEQGGEYAGNRNIVQK